MIAFGCPISDPHAYWNYAEPGIRLAAEPDSEVYAFAAVGTILRSNNVLLDTAGRLHGLEAMVLVHPHAEITDPAFCAKVRDALSDPDVAVVGAAGARNVSSIAWWEGEIVAADVVHRYSDHGGGKLPAFAWAGEILPPPAEVEAVDGMLMVLSPWAVRNLRFDEALGLGFGYDVDYCLQARAAARKVVVADLALTHHRALALVEDLDLWVEGHVKMSEKWPADLDSSSLRDGASWEQRARRAEAEREAARAIAYARALQRDARLLDLQRSLEEITQTRSWSVTEPLRRLNKARADRREG